MIAPVVYEYMEWMPHKQGVIDHSATGSYKARYGTIEVHGDRDVPQWCRQASPSEADAYRPKQMRLL